MHAPNTAKILNFKSLREQVYDYLREGMNRGVLAPGASINLNEICQELGISKTPLRDALLQLEAEGFVTILPRRGCVVNALTQEEIRHLYEIIGSLESSVIENEFHKITPERIREMRALNEEMGIALERDDFDRYYAANVKMHDCYIGLTRNERLKRIVKTMKQRLYDFPRKQVFIKNWEVASTKEHEKLIDLIEARDAREAADHVKNVHWSYDVQSRFIEMYYSNDLTAARRAEGY